MADDNGQRTFGQGVDTSEWSDVGVKFSNVRFGQSNDYKDNDGNLPVVFISDLENENGQTREDQILSIGKGYVILEGGAAVEHSRAKFNRSDQAGFSNNSKGQTFLDSLAAANLDALLDRFETVGQGPRNAAFWEGLVVHMVEEEIPFGKPDANGKQKSFKQPVATKLHGWDVEIPEDGEDEVVEALAPAPAAKTKPKPPAKKAAPKATTPTKTAADFGIGEQVFTELVDLAKASESFDDFLTSAYDLDEISDDAVQAAVDNEDAGIWSVR